MNYVLDSETQASLYIFAFSKTVDYLVYVYVDFPTP